MSKRYPLAQIANGHQSSKGVLWFIHLPNLPTTAISHFLTPRYNPSQSQCPPWQWQIHSHVQTCHNRNFLPLILKFLLCGLKWFYTQRRSDTHAPTSSLRSTLCYISLTCSWISPEKTHQVFWFIRFVLSLGKYIKWHFLLSSNSTVTDKY